MKHINFSQLDYIIDLFDIYNDSEIRNAYHEWYYHDNSKTGLLEILLYQLIKQEKEEFGDKYNRNHDLLAPLLLRFKQENSNE